MLNVRLRNLSTGPDLRYAFNDVGYQEFVKTELISCIKLHQRLIRCVEAINNLLYFPIFYYSASAVLLALAIILGPKTSASALRYGFIVMGAFSLILVFCILGQLLENEFEKVFVCGCNTAWYLWNTDNRRFLCLFLCKTQKEMVLSSSGIVTINYQLLISLYRAIYPTLIFLLQVYGTI
ncbi:hypothetical protein Zmor_019721 [Zophobas morio]|uniref:Uncharacterized protein n=1 Tax=Zophobas morio TaxID=2755281 RepID=A0AA38I2G2_9CUCU|nr:hypothetical protein Zmor_019721 [Zophobas morio]